MASAIYDYAVIGDCRSAALVSRDGSIDWLCWPHFDSPSVLGALLDDGAGRWAIAPVAPFETSRAYEPGTNVLVTRFTTGSGSIRVTDLMPVASEADARALLLPEHEVLRIVECEDGEVDVEMVFEPRPDYGRRAITLRDAGPLGVRVETRAGLLTLRTDLPLSASDGAARARARLHAGEARHASLTYTREGLAVLPPLGAWSRASLERTLGWWRAWSARMRYGGPFRDAVLRSALALKLLVFAPSGAIVAAPTTSLPERVGGDSNWDYRFCWLRDASLTLRALLELGYAPEAEAFLSWLLHTTRLTQPRLEVLYDTFGKIPPREKTLDHLSGYRGSKPVRVGNGAVGQLQLDIYGEVIDAAALFVRSGGRLDRETQKLLCRIGDYVRRNWHRPDAGIWEPRSGARHHTHSRALCWVALDRLIELNDAKHLRCRDVDDLRRVREQIRRDVEENGWHGGVESYVAGYGTDDVDAALLLLPWYQIADPSGPRMRSTWARIEEQLGAGDGLLYRYRSGDSPGEGAFGICSFWGAEYLALGGGSIEDARRRIESLLRHANDVGLYAEEIDPTTGEGLGNFPQAFTHVGLINAALTLERRIEAREPLGRRVTSHTAELSREARS